MGDYTPQQTLQIITELGIDVVSETGTVWTCLCPFHGNINTPAFAVNKTNGTFICYNIACGASGKIENLIMSLSGKNLFAALRMIARAAETNPENLSEKIKRNLAPKTIPTFSQAVLDGMRDQFWASQEAQDYMHSRGFRDETLRHFDIGYSSKRGMVGVPMHDAQGKPIGLIGRSITEKKFNNSKGLPRNLTLWNIHRAKKNPKLVITEASFDGMKVWQATGFDAAATIGSYFSNEYAYQINKYFTHVVIMTDDDQEMTFNVSCKKCRLNGERECIGHNTGLELGMSIADACRGINVSWAHLGGSSRFGGVKDAMDMSDEDVKYAVDNAIPHIEMIRSAPA